MNFDEPKPLTPAQKARNKKISGWFLIVLGILVGIMNSIVDAQDITGGLILAVILVCFGGYLIDSSKKTTSKPE